MLPIATDTLLQQRYRILKPIGERESWRTYLATDSARTALAGSSRADKFCEIQEFIPITQLPDAVTQAKEFFKHQASLLYQLQHPQIPRFWATFEEQNRLFLVLDYIEGSSYRELLDERRAAGTVFNQQEVWQLLMQVLPALAYLHSKGIIHRDLCPENIILRSRDRLPVLSGFGVVTEFAERLRAVSPDLQIGKLGYAAAEQLSSGQLYPSSDLYALGVTAIVLLTGKEPTTLFNGNLINWDWRRWTQISDEFANVLGRMLNPDPQSRYQSASEVYRDLQSINLNLTTTQPDLGSVPVGKRLSQVQTMAVGGDPIAPENQAAITHIKPKSIWERPEVFIPLGIAISALAGLGSWLVVSNLLHKNSETATVPAKQVEFNNPTIPTDGSPNPATTDTLIQPALHSVVVKEGSVDPVMPVRYKFAGIEGQNLDIQLGSPIAPLTQDSTGTSATDGTPATSPDPVTTGVPTPSSSVTQTNPATGSVTPVPIAPTQVLISILSPTGKPVDAQADRVVGWRGQLPTTGDYTIEVRPIAGLSGKSYPYKLSVTQLQTLPATSSSTPVTTPTPIATPPIGISAPIDGNIITPTPSGSSPTQSDISPTIIPSVTPTPSSSSTPSEQTSGTRTTETQTPRRRRRRRQVSAEESTTTPRRTTRVTTTETETPTPRRRRRTRITTSETETPTPRRRRTRVTTSETETPTPRRSTQTENSSPSTAPSSKPVQIDVPSPKAEPIDVPAPRKNKVPSGGGDNQTN